MRAQRTKERRWHIAAAYVAAGTLCALLPAVSGLGAAAGFVCLTLVIALSLCPNGCLLALASAAGQGPAMPFNLAVFNSLGNVAGFFGSLLLGVVVDRTCSYDAAYVTMGVVLIGGGALALTVADRPAGAAHETEALNGGVQSGAMLPHSTEMTWQGGESYDGDGELKTPDAEAAGVPDEL